MCVCVCVCVCVCIYLPHFPCLTYIHTNTQVLLIVDNCPGHGQGDEVRKFLPSWVHYEEMPPNTTPLIQPMDGGVIQAFKRRYRRHLLTRMVDKSYTSVDEFKKDFTVYDALVLFMTAWEEAQEEEIRKVWNRTLLKEMDKVMAEDDEDEKEE